MKKKIGWFVGLLFAFGTVSLGALGCGSGNGASDSAAGGVAMKDQVAAASPMTLDDAKATSTPATPTAGGASANANKPRLASYKQEQATPRSIIRKAQISIRVNDVEKAEKSLDKSITALGGYVDSANSTDLTGEKPAIDVTARIPVGNFDRALDTFEALGVRLSKTENSEDVTGQIADLDARLKTMSAEEETYRGLLKEAHKLDAVISLTDKLTEVRGNIESMTAQRKAVGSQAALSTVSIHLEREAVAVRRPTDPNWLAQTWGESTTNMGGMVRGVASGAIWLLVYCPLWLPFLLLLRFGIRYLRTPEKVSEQRPV